MYHCCFSVTQWRPTLCDPTDSSSQYRTLTLFIMKKMHEEVLQKRQDWINRDVWSKNLHVSSSKRGEGNGNPLQYSCLENPMIGGTWQASVHGVARSRTRLSNFTFTFHFHALEKEMATHSSVLAWRIPGTGESGGLLSMGSHRVGHD